MAKKKKTAGESTQPNGAVRPMGDLTAETAALRADAVRLVQRADELEKKIEAAQQQTAGYRETLREWVLSSFTSEQLKQFACDDDEGKCLPLEQFVGDLEAIVASEK